jgi:hypothetical protein
MINELNREMEELETGNKLLCSDIEKYKGQGVTSDLNRQKIFKGLEDQIQRATTTHKM